LVFTIHPSMGDFLTNPRPVATISSGRQAAAVALPRLEPMLATTGHRVHGDDWALEPKLDGSPGLSHGLAEHAAVGVGGAFTTSP
jgi:ATP-dependent DNA ligase